MKVDSNLLSSCYLKQFLVDVNCDPFQNRLKRSEFWIKIGFFQKFFYLPLEISSLSESWAAVSSRWWILWLCVRNVGLMHHELYFRSCAAKSLLFK